MFVEAALMSMTLSSEPAYPQGFEEFATRIFERIEAHPDGQEILHYAACRIWFYETEQSAAGPLVHREITDLWDIEIPDALVRWSNRVDPDHGLALAKRFLAEHHERLSDRMCYAIVVGFMVDYRAAEAALSTP